MPDQPVRTCVGCRARRSQDQLLRLRLDPGRQVRIDRAGPGRGAWLCADRAAACLATAIQRRALPRAFRAQPDAGSVQVLLNELSNGSPPIDR